MKIYRVYYAENDSYNEFIDIQEAQFWKDSNNIKSDIVEIEKEIIDPVQE